MKCLKIDGSVFVQPYCTDRRKKGRRLKNPSKRLFPRALIELEDAFCAFSVIKAK